MSEMPAPDNADTPRNTPAVFGAGAVIGTIGGLIGLGGAEFRLPILIAFFRFPALQAVILNKAMSLVVVGTALPFRMQTVPVPLILDNWHVVANLLAGSLVGAWLGAGWATRLRAEVLYKIIAALMFGIAAALLFGHGLTIGAPLFIGPAQVIAGVIAGFGIGIVAALMGVAGGELLIPTLILLFGADIKLAGSLSLCVSLPTMIVGFTRYSRDQSFSVLGRNKVFVLVMAAGSICGTFIGARLLGIVPETILLPALAIILVLSGWKVWRHKQPIAAPR